MTLGYHAPSSRRTSSSGSRRPTPTRPTTAGRPLPRPGVPGGTRGRAGAGPAASHDRGGLGGAHGGQRLDPARERRALRRATRPRATPRPTRRPTASPRRSALYSEVFARSSYDGKGAEVVLTVHYEQNYDNAFWNGTQLVFGDGDGKVFGSFTKPVDVLGHEFTHAVTQFTAALTYQGQSGALNESVSDCFGICVKQRLLGQTAETGRLAGRPRASSCPASTPGRCATWPIPARRTTTRRWARTPRSATWRTTSTPPTTTAASTPTPASPTAPSTSPPPRSAATPGRAPARSGTPR